MGHKQIHFRSEAREKILKGAAAIADAVRVTLGLTEATLTEVPDPNRERASMGQAGMDQGF